MCFRMCCSAWGSVCCGLLQCMSQTTQHFQPIRAICVAVCCSVLQCVAACDAVCCSAWQGVADYNTQCITLQHTASHTATYDNTLPKTAALCVAVCCGLHSISSPQKLSVFQRVRKSETVIERAKERRQSARAHEKEGK